MIFMITWSEDGQYWKCSAHNAMGTVGANCPGCYEELNGTTEEIEPEES